ncbi:hypothetical protein JRO89_XS08G0037900 [Xanthoceras sorbifolium]|uniref:Cytochrome P450 CYP72A219-like n=1 Tax=Xanthoceras sorbifolium TaxID=99658 RepID=A0ABQ8HNJ7_9ROSI|nr:hypothetical protein JRO89_XS08G0037900 [Xanthoceras sorbifolium]
MLVLAVACVLIISVIWSLKLLYKIWWRPKTIEKELKKQGIHGYPYRLLFGNTKEKIKPAKESESMHDIMPRVNPLLHKLATTYKKVFVVWVGIIPRVSIMDPKLIKEIMLNKSGDFPQLEGNSFTKLFATGLASYDGDKWAIHRKILNPAFHIEKLKQMLPAFSTCSEELIERWEKLVSSGGSSEVDVSQEFLNLTGDVISRVAFGTNFEQGRLVCLLLKEQGTLFLRSYLNMIFPILRFLPTQVNKRMRQIHGEVGALLRVIIENRQRSIQAGNDEKDDLLSLLLKSNQQTSDDRLTIDDVIEECKLFYFAGQETTATLLTWSMILLSMHQNWQERARKEVLQILRKNKPTFDDLNHLKIVNMILLEVLRLYPPTAPSKRTIKKTKLGNMYLPAGVHLSIPLLIVHRDPELWGEDALEFNPERFAQGITNASKDEISYFPFGWGPRKCIGQNFALLEAKLALSQILQYFSFEHSPTYTHAPCSGISLQPKYGAQIILRKL